MIITNNSAIHSSYSVKKADNKTNSSQKLAFGTSTVNKVADFVLKDVYDKKKFLFIPYKKLNKGALKENSEKLDKILEDNKLFSVMVDASKKIHKDVIKPINAPTEVVDTGKYTTMSTEYARMLSLRPELDNVEKKKDASGLKNIINSYMQYRNFDVHSKSVDIINQSLKGAQKSFNT